MNTQIPDNDVNGGTATKAASHTIDKAAAKRKPRAIAKPKPDPKSKRNQLIALLSKPNGARVSVLVDRLGWQAHTVRAALSGLRKQGFGITTSKSAKTGESIYAIAARPAEEDASSEKASS